MRQNRFHSQLPTHLALLLLSGAIGSAFAQTAANADESATSIIVTGTRTPKAIDKIPGAVTVVSKEELARTLALTEDATAVLARTVPGYAESSQAMSNTGENLRGRIALRLFDGVPQGSPLREGTRNATFTDMGLVGRIEVINGPSASEGIGGAGGIINYISRSPTKMGDEFQIVSRYTTQFEDDSGGWKLGANYMRKAESYDLLVSISQVDRGITYDGNGRRIGRNASGSLTDSVAKNAFAKGGFNFGDGNAQRVQFSYSQFKVLGNGNYIAVLGDRATGLTDTAERGRTLGAKTEFNDFEQFTLAYKNQRFFGGFLSVDLYAATQAMRYLPEDGADRQDPLIAPLGTLIDQSEVHSKKKGLRTSWTRPDLASISGLEARMGVDLVEDVAQQRLALTNRLWVPPMQYRSVAPYVQLSYDIGPVTISGGVRREDGKMHVDDYTTVYFRNRAFVEGGDLSYQATLPNVGVIWRPAKGVSVFASYGKGFTLPNVGIPLRNVNAPGQSVKGILDLQAVIVDNQEVGATWTGAMGSLGGSVYKSKSKLGVSLSTDPVTRDFVMNRVPVEISGVELNGELKINREWKATALYSHIVGKTTFVTGGPLDRRMGVNDINPDKLGLAVNWKPNDALSVNLGGTQLQSRTINEGTSARESTKGHTLYDLDLSYNTGRFGKFTLGVENLTNKYYILSWSQVDFFQNHFAGRGRVFSISHEISF